MTRHIVARTSDIPPGGNKVVGVEGRDIVVFHVNGEFFPLPTRCPHPGAPLAKAASLVSAGDRVGYFSREGRLGEQFDTCNGHSWFDPKRVKVHAYPVAVESG